MVRAKLAAGMTAAVLAAGPAAAASWDLPMAWPAGNFHVENAEVFAEEVRAATDGAVEITVHPGGALGFKGPEMLKAVRDGLVGPCESQEDYEALGQAKTMLFLDRLPELWTLGSGQQLLALLGRAQQHAAEQQTLLARHGAESRLAGFLVGLARRRERQGLAGDRLPLPMTRTDLANHLGMTLECLSRVLSRLSRRGVIAAERREVTQKQPEALQALAQGTGV